MDSRIAKRPNYNEAGKKISIEVNQYAAVKRKANFKIWQCDVRCPVIPAVSLATRLECMRISKFR